MICSTALSQVKTKVSEDKTVRLKVGVPYVPKFSGYHLSDEKARSVLVLGKDFKACQLDREDLRMNLAECSKADMWWESTYFKFSMGVFAGFALSKLEDKL